ncbi:hypothetical protein HPB47_000655 [Ixodes persulcatus]|uniref:Uncharacterized protein n=1 Tax=Ixodes persulcatus TaxID=34615 RepID=A0AC60PSP9_IXOPE|nr:hypothetical protein HPB47_000655 [Ixodes persulcatus]
MYEDPDGRDFFECFRMSRARNLTQTTLTLKGPSTSSRKARGPALANRDGGSVLAIGQRRPSRLPRGSGAALKCESLLSPIVGGLSLELPARLCRSTCRASGADAVREGVLGCPPPTPPTSSRWLPREEVLGHQASKRRLRHGGIRLSTRGGLTRPHTIPPSNQGPGVMKGRTEDNNRVNLDPTEHYTQPLIRSCQPPSRRQPDAAVAKAAPLKLGARVPPPSGQILKTLAVSAAGILGPPPGRRRRPKPCTCCGRAAGGELQRETAQDGRQEAPACLVRGDGGNNGESSDDGK